MYKKLFLLLILILIGCSAANEIPKTSKNKNIISLKDKYSIVFYDSLDNKLREGTLSFNKYDTGFVSGELIIIKRYVNVFKGSNLLNGKFTGSLIRETTQLVLPSKVADYNVYINLKRTINGFSGDWAFTTKRGNENHGKVICKKI